MTQDKQSPIIGFIGGGNMAAAMISGLISKGFLAQDIQVSEPSAERVAWLSDKYGVSTVSKTQDVWFICKCQHR
ncbi:MULTISPECIES: NAD(P)-binding domain-containing protein [unclassified Vibrio]|uniref:NAD(P)-binding domain-containing protein n=1 Tax=Vibrio sp. HB236076 TaxID=3232307 RepID=A0AB39HIQ9_9VIBR|nr:NAD(P)-binding domain-containing protein [Vibrio sp. HB161653]MDP5254726.1 NAD(P)-binding domain-containing protein [Vibrio sp. HB161653]